MGHRPPTFRGGVIRYRKHTNHGKKQNNEKFETIVEKHEHKIQEQEQQQIPSVIISSIVPEGATVVATIPKPVDISTFDLVEEKKTSYCIIQ